MNRSAIAGLRAEISSFQATHPVGRVISVAGGLVRVSGLSGGARLGDRVRIVTARGALSGEVLQLEAATLLILPDEAAEGVALGDRVRLLGPAEIAPSEAWIGRVIDPFGAPLDGRPLLRGPCARALRAATRSARGWRPGWPSSTPCCRSCAGSGSGFSRARAWANPCCSAISRATCRPILSWWR